ncbi:unnamed protein product [Leptosia nina]|uniref:Uncharacterized protein n=1 Tax=Leptosia nina TaxID=320188 RepID=A0AAV1JJI2_9NEOP
MDLTTRRENDGVNVTECREVNGEGVTSEVTARKTSSFSIRHLVGDDQPPDGAVNGSEGEFCRSLKFFITTKSGLSGCFF